MESTVGEILWINVYKSNKMRALKKGIGKKLDSGLLRHVTEVVIKRYVK
ncbi:hypothetical protein H9I48_05920 [Wolbachia pipientis]|nr:hypothetical protein [Wolbachia pipientis]